jgi:hypothetical protein
MAKQTFTTGQVLTAAQMTSLQQTAMLGGATTAKTANYVLVAADAGTTVAMNASGATTITVNTGLFAAGDTVFIQNLGAGACTVTAGTATVASSGSLVLPQNDAGILYFTSTGAAIFYDWVQAAGSSSGLVFIQSATVSAAADLSMDGVFTSTYQNYLIVGDFDGSTDATTRIRFRTSGSDNATSNYNYAVFFNPNSGALSGTGGGTGDDNGKFANHGSSGTCYFSATILNPQVAEQTGWLSNGYRFSSARTDHFGNFSATTQFDGFKLYPDSGTFTGTVRLYGLANS